MAEKRGRPLKPATDRKTASLKFRCRPATHDQVRAAAEAAGRSASEMVEHIIERHFAEDRMRAIAREEIARDAEERRAEAAERLQRIIDRQPSINDRARDLFRQVYVDDHPNGGQ